MNRREFLAAGVGAGLGSSGLGSAAVADASGNAPGPDASLGKPYRNLFPRLDHEVYLNAASGTPLGKFAEDGLRRYEELWRLGPSKSSWNDVWGMLSELPETFGRLIGARAHEIALVHCTKEGEQTVLDGLPALARGGNLVTNDMHFSGSLHNLVGLKKAGMDVRIVRAETVLIPSAIPAFLRTPTARRSSPSRRLIPPVSASSCGRPISWSHWRATGSGCLRHFTTTTGMSICWLRYSIARRQATGKSSCLEIAPN